MPEIEVAIVRIADDAFPVFVECKLIDARGREHTFVEKAPVVSAQDLSARSTLPVPGHIACEIEHELNDATGRALLRVNTARPHGVESIAGNTSFELFAEQVSR